MFNWAISLCSTEPFTGPWVSQWDSDGNIYTLTTFLLCPSHTFQLGPFSFCDLRTFLQRGCKFAFPFAMAPVGYHFDLGSLHSGSLLKTMAHFHNQSSSECFSYFSEFPLINLSWERHLDGSVGWAPDFGSGHDLTVGGFKPRVRLSADSSEPGASFRFCVSLALCLPHSCSVSLSLSQK